MIKRSLAIVLQKKIDYKKAIVVLGPRAGRKNNIDQ